VAHILPSSFVIADLSQNVRTVMVIFTGLAASADTISNSSTRPRSVLLWISARHVAAG
jgi:hypothetical protein